MDRGVDPSQRGDATRGVDIVRGALGAVAGCKTVRQSPSGESPGVQDFTLTPDDSVAAMKETQPPIDTDFIFETELLRRVPISRRTSNTWRGTGILPFIQPPGSRRVIYHWPSVQAALLRIQKGTTN